MTYLRAHFTRIILGLTAAVIWLLANGAISAQTLQFIFVAPTTAINSGFGAAGAFTGLPPGYSGVQVTAANQAAFNTAASPNVLRTYNQLQAGTALRNRVNQVLQISGGKVDVTFYLVDDRTGLAGGAGFFAPATAGGVTYVWPAASVSPSAGGRYWGQMGLGERASTQIQGWPGGWMAWEGTILHESLHTQFVGEKTKWGSINIVYGGDAGHWTSELLGEQELPFEEGLGTYFGSLHNNPAGINDITTFFRRADERYDIESRSVLAGDATVWNAPHTQDERPVPATLPPGGRYFVRHYRWRDVPGFYLLFTESTSTAFHLFFWQRVNGSPDQAFGFINDSSRAMWQERRKRYLTYAVNRLSLQLEQFAATAQGAAAKSAGTLTSSMFPFALLDILTHYGMSESDYKADYNRKNPDRNPRAFTEYWGRRQPVRDLVQAHLNASPVRIDEAIAEAHRYFRQADTILAANP